ncbi:MAG: YHYH domain-containing protein [Clostridiales bacterium]|nr:YHYH domain-containing protein [Clostridiales bacterium]
MHTCTRYFKLCALLIAAGIMLLAAPLASYAHPGRVDSSGGHNKTSDGTYHYHAGSDRKIEYSTPQNGATPRPSPTPAPTPQPAVKPVDIIGLVNDSGQKITMGMKKAPIDLIMRKSGTIVPNSDEENERIIKHYYGEGLSITYKDGVCCIIEYSITEPIDNTVLDELPKGWTVIGGAGLGAGFDEIAKAYEAPEDAGTSAADKGAALISFYADEDDEWHFDIFSDIEELPPEYHYTVLYTGFALDGEAGRVADTITIALKPTDKHSVYWGHSGDKVHIDPNCRTIENGVFWGSLEEARAAGHTEGWCQVCSKGWTDARLRASGNPNIE